MKKSLFVILVLALSLSACGQAAEQKADEVNPAQLQLTDVQMGLAPDLPQALQPWPGTPSTSYYIPKLNNGHNFFYTSAFSVSELSELLKSTLTQAKWKVVSENKQAEKVTIQFQQGAENLNLTVSSKIPTNYPSEMSLTGTLVSGLYAYELPPQP